VEARGWHAPIVRLRQPIDLLRFRAMDTARANRRTVLVLSNYLDGTRAGLIEAACRANGLTTSWLGGAKGSSPRPELEIAGAHAVIGLGRSVLEAMAAGRAAYVYGVAGGDGWVTPERYPAMEADGFGGTALPQVVIDRDRMASDLGAWSEDMGEMSRDLASAHHRARDHAVELVNLGRKLEDIAPTEPALVDELARLIRAQWWAEGQAATAVAELERLRSRLAEALARVTDLEAIASDAVAQLDDLRNTRRYRLAARAASPLDRLRELAGRPAPRKRIAR
jgi:hypothetical protein